MVRRRQRGIDWQHSVPSPVLWQLLVEAQGHLEDETPAVAIELNDYGRETLCARIESQVE